LAIIDKDDRIISKANLSDPAALQTEQLWQARITQIKELRKQISAGDDAFSRGLLYSGQHDERLDIQQKTFGQQSCLF